MGYLAHHGVIVYISGYVYDQPDRFSPPDLEEFRQSLPEYFRPLLIGPVPTAINGDFVAAFLPDGSKEGWGTSDRGDEIRARFIDLFSFRHDDGSGPYDVVELRFGGDDPELAWLKQPGNEDDA